MDTATESTSTHNDEITRQLETNNTTLSTNQIKNAYSEHSNSNPPVNDARNKSTENNVFSDTLLLNEPHKLVDTDFTPKPFAHDASNVITIESDGNSQHNQEIEKDKIADTTKPVHSKEVDVNIQNKLADTQMNHAEQEEKIETVNIFQQNKKDNPSTPLTTGFHQIHLAAAAGLVFMLSGIIRIQCVDVNATDENRNTPLHYATQNGRTECVKILLAQRKIHWNSEDSEGWTPLHSAVENGSVHCMKGLLSYKQIKANVQDRSGYTLLSLAALLWPNRDCAASADTQRHPHSPVSFRWLYRTPRCSHCRL